MSASVQCHVAVPVHRDDELVIAPPALFGVALKRVMNDRGHGLAPASALELAHEPQVKRLLPSGRDRVVFRLDAALEHFETNRAAILRRRPAPS